MEVVMAKMKNAKVAGEQAEVYMNNVELGAGSEKRGGGLQDNARVAIG